MPLSADDHVAINQLYVAYNHRIDFGEAAEWADLFVEEGTLDSGVNVTEGREALVEFHTVTRQMVPDIRHLVSNILIEGDGDAATGAGYLHATAGAGDNRTTLMTGLYNDTMRRTSDGWKFVSRAMTPDQ